MKSSLDQRNVFSAILQVTESQEWASGYFLQLYEEKENFWLVNCEPL
jgi:hypothetical protein